MEPIVRGKHLYKKPRPESTRGIHPRPRIGFLGREVFREIGVQKAFAGDVEEGYFLGLEAREVMCVDLIIPECAIQVGVCEEEIEFESWVGCIEPFGSDNFSIGIRLFPLAQGHVMLAIRYTPGREGIPQYQEQRDT